MHDKWQSCSIFLKLRWKNSIPSNYYELSEKSMSFLAHWYWMYNSYLWRKIKQKCAIDLSFFLSSFPLFPHLSPKLSLFVDTPSPCLSEPWEKHHQYFCTTPLHPCCLSPRIHGALLSQSRREQDERKEEIQEEKKIQEPLAVDRRNALRSN